MSDYKYKFKAGDFTSGKMGEIFKSAFFGRWTTVINHKQFGDCYLIPEARMKEVTNFVFSSFLNMCVDDGMVRRDGDMGNLDGMRLTEYPDRAKIIIDKDIDGISNEFDYFQVLEAVINCLYMDDIDEEYNSDDK